MMKAMLRAVIGSFLLLVILSSVSYPPLLVGISESFLPQSIPVVDNNVILPITKSLHIKGTEAMPPEEELCYFWARPYDESYILAAKQYPNFGLLNPVTRTIARERITALRKADPSNKQEIPPDLITVPRRNNTDITEAAANYQVERIARIRGLPQKALYFIINKNLYLFDHKAGDYRVNVGKLNQELDKLSAYTV